MTYNVRKIAVNTFSSPCPVTKSVQMKERKKERKNKNTLYINVSRECCQSVCSKFVCAASLSTNQHPFKSNTKLTSYMRDREREGEETRGRLQTTTIIRHNCKYVS